MKTSWPTLMQEALSCEKCRLCQTRTHVVIGEGDPHASLMFIGSDAMILKFETPDGSQVHNERVFCPRSTERGSSQFGPTPSEFEQFLSKCKCLIKALDIDLFNKIEKDGDKFQAPDFAGFVALLKKYLDKKVDTEVDIKLIPTQGQYVGFPGFPARISKDGNLYIANNFIGDNYLNFIYFMYIICNWYD